MEPREAAVRWITEGLNGEEIVGFACDALIAGYDTPSLRVLAGEQDTTLRSVTPIFLQTLHELGVQIPSRNEAFRTLLLEVLRGIANGASSPVDGAGRIWSILNSLTGGEEDNSEFVARLYAFVVLEDLYWDRYWDQTVDKQEIEKEIILEARRLMEDIDKGKLDVSIDSITSGELS